MLQWLARCILYFYAPKEPSITECEFVVPMSYALRGTREHPELPEISAKAVLKAIKIATQFYACVAWANTGFLGKEWQEKENALKFNLNFAPKYFSLRRTVREIIVAPEGVLNTVSEVQCVGNCISRLNPSPKNIVVVCDRAHARRARLLWERRFPKTKILVSMVDGEYGRDHPCVLVRAPFRLLALNMLCHCALILHLDGMITLLRHPTRFQK